MKTIGDRIKAKRKELNLTQLELAEKLNVTDRAVSKWEQNEGNPDLNIVPALCDVLGVTTDYLLLGKEEDDRISLDDMDATKRLNYLIRKDDDANFVKFGCTKSLYSKAIESLNNKSISRLELSVWESIIDANAKKIFKICCDGFIQAYKELDIASCLIRGITDKFVKMVFDVDRVDVFKVLDVRHFAIGSDQKLMGHLYNVRMKYNANSGESSSDYVNGGHATKISLETLDYMFENAKKSPKCFEYITSFDSPVVGRYNEVQCEFTHLEKTLLELSIKHDNVDVFKRVLAMFKEYAELCNYETANGIFYKYNASYVYHSGGYYPIGRIFSFDESIIKKVILWDKSELLQECLEFNKLAIKKLTNVDGKHYDKSNRGVFLLTEPEIERYFKLNNSKTTKEDKFLLECVNNRIIIPSKITESRDLKFVKKVLNDNYYNYFEYAFDAVTNKKEKEFFRFLIDNELESLATKLMMNEKYDKDHKEFLLTCWNFFNNYSASKVLMVQNKILDGTFDSRASKIVYPDSEKFNEWIWKTILNQNYYNERSHEANDQITECICSLKGNKIIAYIKAQKDAVYDKVVSLIAAEKKAEEDKLERAKIVKGLTKSYFEKLLKDDGKELFYIKLCALFDAILRFDFKIEGEDLSERMKAYFQKLELELPQPRSCDDGWGYMVDDREWFEGTVKPAREKFEHISNLLHRLRMQRNNISHAETHDVEELSMAELKECLEYVFSINKVEE